MTIPQSKLDEYWEYAKQGLYNKGKVPEDEREWFMSGVVLAERFFSRRSDPYPTDARLREWVYPLLPSELCDIKLPEQE